MPQLACNACRHLLPDLEAQKEHYRTEWHMYNVKRRCAGMEAVPIGVFEEKVLPVLREAEGDASRANDGTLGFGVKGGKRAVSRVDRAKFRDSGDFWFFFLSFFLFSFFYLLLFSVSCFFFFFLFSIFFFFISIISPSLFPLLFLLPLPAYLPIYHVVIDNALFHL